MKKLTWILCILSLYTFVCKPVVMHAQQLPYYTQFKPGNIFLNPAVAGTKRLVDARINYRRQWVGFPDAPITQSIAVNSRLMKGTLGAGIG